MFFRSEIWTMKSRRYKLQKKSSILITSKGLQCMTSKDQRSPKLPDMITHHLKFPDQMSCSKWSPWEYWTNPQKCFILIREIKQNTVDSIKITGTTQSNATN